MNRLRQTIPDPVGEATGSLFRIPDVQVIDATAPTGLRFATALEMAGVGCELTVTDHLGAVINSLDAVPLLPDHGTYNATTGVLLVELEAADNPIVGTPVAGTGERHMALVHAPGLLWVEIVFNVQNALMIPTPP